ncbi:conserved hypothetical protein [Bathymodiolus platifrons methanotrophic gill symbiont]|uniref:DUF445 family protein n=1 Tax=Bathymodiolus platifrons methanotrophic gill symbiont TaxID=113268 RepID=UPI000B40B097|nr:DUF445 family protein [Bathymodiolus platifrons methanotrophic gill symbiont]MCK5869349.1 DUF445 domain-containing protein [Methyloprofundus sp.]TXK98781.1 DUF445 domain-containing protein [Methylococcaceae bacterium CS4]TXK99111.1 DUF445 domain-containing protein [Methylococcaceae bacterium CS5]TXL04765.1 DUF445 domain-containing protein [Methylococcaceae bacterium CS1]TXL06655.1 DUF445 domain-containing protein [Methylococcaceae bacterium CS3]TXL10784.1 DUF445 domain-containing protein [
MKKIFNKSFITNFLAALIIAAGYFSPVYGELIKTIGFFALSGALTNWIAIHMLFEKVPLLYGSGIIPNRFEEFKDSIKDLMMHQFFTVENVEQFIETEEQQGDKVLNLEPLLAAVDYDRIFEGLISSIMESSFGAMLQMMGGEEALIPLKEPFTAKIQVTLTEMVESDKFKAALKQGLNAHQIGEDIISKIETVIDKRLAELTPELVKEMVQKIIREHLGWLVVWGGFFGGLMGAAFYFV